MQSGKEKEVFSGHINSKIIVDNNLLPLIMTDPIRPFLLNTIEEIILLAPRPYWAVNENSSFIQASDLLPEEGHFTIHFARTEELVKNSDFKEVDMTWLFLPENIKSNNNHRIYRIIQHWINKEYLDPPKIHFNAFEKKIEFEDGRHRAKTSYFLGFQIMPVAIHVEDFEAVRGLIKINNNAYLQN